MKLLTLFLVVLAIGKEITDCSQVADLEPSCNKTVSVADFKNTTEIEVVKGAKN